MSKYKERIILLTSLIIIFVIIVLNVYSINLFKAELYEKHYTEEAELMLNGIKKFYISNRSDELQQIVNNEILIEALKCGDERSCDLLEKYILDVNKYIDYEFFAVFDREKNKLFSDASKNVDEMSIIEAYKSLYIDNFSGILLKLPLMMDENYNNNLYFRKNIFDDGELIGSVLLATSGDEIIEFMNNFDEIAFILDPSGDFYIGSQKPTEDFVNFVKINSNNELEKQGKGKYKNFYFDVFELNDDGWKLLIIQSFSQIQISFKIKILINISYALTIILIILFVLIFRIRKKNIININKLKILTEALKKTETKISIVKDDSKIIYSNHDDFKYIYQNPENLYFKSDILSAIRKEWNFEKKYSFEIEGERKWFMLHLNILDVFKSSSCAVISLSEFTNERLYQQRLESMALYDDLTGCYNRDSGMNKIKRDLKNKSKLIELSMIFLDIDNLKYVNDNMGHNMGDVLIKSIVNTMKLSIRSNDYCIRLGGDEFLILLPNCSYSRAVEIILLIEDDVSTIRLTQNNHKASFSFGIVNRLNDDTLDLESMINEADAKMYINKKVKKGKKIPR